MCTVFTFKNSFSLFFTLLIVISAVCNLSVMFAMQIQILPLNYNYSPILVTAFSSQPTNFKFGHSLIIAHAKLFLFFQTSHMKTHFKSKACAFKNLFL